MKLHRIPKIRVALFKESSENATMWIAQCVGFDLIAQGETIAQAQENFRRVLLGHVGLALKYGEDPFPSCLSSSYQTESCVKKSSLRQTLGKVRIAYSELKRETLVPAI